MFSRPKFSHMLEPYKFMVSSLPWDIIPVYQQSRSMVDTSLSHESNPFSASVLHEQSSFLN